MNIRLILNKYKSIPIQARASFWYMLCNILQKGISFIVVPLYVRILTTNEYGQYTVFLSWKEILMIFATLNLYCGVFTKAMVDYKEERDEYTSCMQGLSTLITTLVFSVFLFTKNIWDSFFSIDSFVLLPLFLYFIFYPSFSFWSVRQKVENKYIKMVTVTLLIALITPIVSICIYSTTTLKANAIILGYLLVQGSVGAFFYFYHFYKSKAFFIKKFWTHALKFNIPLIPHYLSLIILGQLDRIMIDYYCGSDKVAIYNLAYQISMAMNIIVAAINNTFVPWSYEKLKNNEIINLKKVSRQMCMMMSIFTFGIMLIAPEILGILGTSAYKDAVWVIPAITLSCYFTFCYNLFSTVEFYFNATQYVTIASILGSILNVILNSIFIPKFGFIAAGYTTMICYCFFMLMHYLFMRKICKQLIDGIIPYDVTFILYSSIVLLFLGLLCLFSYFIPIVRYSLIIFVCIIIFVKKEYFINLVKEMRGD